MDRDRCPVCGRFLKDREAVKPWIRTGHFHGYGKAGHAKERGEVST